MKDSSSDDSSELNASSFCSGNIKSLSSSKNSLNDDIYICEVELDL